MGVLCYIRLGKGLTEVYVCVWEKKLFATTMTTTIITTAINAATAVQLIPNQLFSYAVSLSFNQVFELSES